MFGLDQRWRYLTNHRTRSLFCLVVCSSVYFGLNRSGEYVEEPILFGLGFATCFADKLYPGTVSTFCLVVCSSVSSGSNMIWEDEQDPSSWICILQQGPRGCNMIHVQYNQQLFLPFYLSLFFITALLFQKLPYSMASVQVRIYYIKVNNEKEGNQ